MLPSRRRRRRARGTRPARSRGARVGMFRSYKRRPDNRGRARRSSRGRREDSRSGLRRSSHKRRAARRWMRRSRRWSHRRRRPRSNDVRHRSPALPCRQSRPKRPLNPAYRRRPCDSCHRALSPPRLVARSRGHCLVHSTAACCECECKEAARARPASFGDGRRYGSRSRNPLRRLAPGMVETPADRKACAGRLLSRSAE